MRKKLNNSSINRGEVPLVLLIAGGLLQIPMARTIKRHGYLLAVADNDAHCISRELADVFCKCDISSISELIQAAHTLHALHPIAIVITAAADLSRQVALVSQALSIPLVTSVSAATLTTNKSQMRNVLQRHKIAMPNFALVTHAKDFNKANVPFPIVVKPIDNMGGRGVKLVYTNDQLPEAIQIAKAHSNHDMVLCEQYIVDPEYSIEMLVKNYRLSSFLIAERIIRCQPFFIEMAHLLPATLSPRVRLAIRGACRKVIRALDIRYGVAKFDLFYRKGQVIIGEVACRLSGGYMSGWTVPQATNINLTDQCFTLTERRLQRQVYTKTRRPIFRAHSYSGECAMLSIPGRIAVIDGIPAARALPGVTHIFARHKSGDNIDFPTNNVQKCLNIIIVAKNTADFWKIARAARLTIGIRIEPADERALSFLFAPSGQQFPMAYCPPPPLLSWLKAQQAVDCQLSSLAFSTFAFSRPRDLPTVIDWHECLLGEIIDQLHTEYGFPLVFDHSAPFSQFLWRAILKGGLQGGRFFIDTLKEKQHLLKKWIQKWNGNMLDA